MRKLSYAAARVNEGLTIREAANKLGVSIGTLCAYENYKRAPRIDIIKKMADLYHVSIEDLRMDEHDG